ncbi:MAG: MotA/TolQ/ExbB proton channel family protein [Pseudobacteriovorax sp.]|nr:MotA/TolQ/ExbB proton channel family protein [Pseudobacteriovorax sp.]
MGARRNLLLQLLTIFVGVWMSLSGGHAYGQSGSTPVEPMPPELAMEVDDIGGGSIFSQALRSGFVVFTVLLMLILFSVLSWAVFLAKIVSLRRLDSTNTDFIKSFWDSRSLNDLNSRLSEYPSSPAKEVFKTGYAELVRGSQLREQTSSMALAVQVATENISRSLSKAKKIERKKMERYLPLLATIASSSPFIGLFGTVWGIMNAFEGIAKTGNASLAAVAPGISEALIATAFGLAAAIPAVIGYNASNAKIRSLTSNLDGFGMDFLNIVERYLITEKKTSPAPNSNY